MCSVSSSPSGSLAPPPHWRDYLVRSWRTPAPPAAVLFPRTGPETTLWRQWLAEGWAHGTALGDDIFAADLDRLNRTFEGVVLWHRLHLAEMVSAPGVTTAYTAATGHESACCGLARQVCASTGGRRSISTQGRGVRPAAETCNDHARQPLHRWDTVLFARLLLARGGARVSGGRARRLPAVGRETRRLRHLLPNRRARLHRGRRQAGAGDRRGARRGRARQLVRAHFRCHRRRHPARRPGHRLFPCRGRGARRLPPLPLQSRPGAGRGRFRGQHHAPGAARRAAELRGSSASRKRSSRPGTCGAA